MSFLCTRGEQKRVDCFQRKKLSNRKAKALNRQLHHFSKHLWNALPKAHSTEVHTYAHKFNNTLRICRFLPSWHAIFSQVLEPPLPLLPLLLVFFKDDASFPPFRGRVPSRRGCFELLLWWLVFASPRKPGPRSVRGSMVARIGL